MCHSHHDAATTRPPSSRPGRGRVVAPLALGIALAALVRGPARGETFNVPCDAGALSAAIASANANGEEDQLWLAPGCTYALPETWTIAYDGGNAVRVYGRRATLSGGGARLPLFVAGGAVAHLDQLVVRDGGGSSQGGGIRNHGTLTLTRSDVVHNEAPQGWGGGIYSSGVLRLHATLVADNEAGAGGGGVDGDGTARLAVFESALVRNAAPYGAGLRNEHTAMLVNSTLYRNAGPLGGALLNESSGRAALSHVTIAENGAPGAGGSALHNEGSLALHASIVADTASGNTDCWSGSPIAAAGKSLVEDGSCGVPGALAGDPKLGAPQGHVAALPLLAGSPAVDTGLADRCPGVDQRGAKRPRDGDSSGTAGCDLGAWEKPPAGACGLLGVEPFLLLPLVRRVARRARRTAQVRTSALV